MTMNINDVVTFDDNSSYVLLSKTLYNNLNYYYLVEVDKEKEIVKDNFKVMKEIKEDEQTIMIEVDDQEEIEQVSQQLIDNL